MNGPLLLLEAMRFTRLTAGRYSQRSSSAALWVKVSSAVPATSLGWSNTIIDLSPSALPSSALLRISRLDSSPRSEEHTSELQSQFHLVCRLLLEKKKNHESLLRCIQL